MPFIDLPAGQWTTVATLANDALFQNRGHRNIFITTEPTGDLDLDEGICIGPQEATQVVAGASVSASPAGGTGFLYYTGI